MKSVGQKTILGQRKTNDDGFTYSYGKYKMSKCRSRYKNQIKRSKRADKRKARNIDNKTYNIYDE